MNKLSEWSRHGFMRLGIGAATVLSAAPQCTLSSELTVGPYYLDRETLRKDITEGKPIDKGSITPGYLAVAAISVDPRATPTPSEDFGPRERRQ